MKKAIIFLSVLCMLLAGCSASGNSQTETTETEETTSIETTTELTTVTTTEVTTKATTETTTVTTVETEPINYDFRNISWGMTIEEVRASESQQPSGEDDETLIYDNVDVGGFDATLVYFFSNDSLFSGGYFIEDNEHTNQNLYIDDYNSLKEKYTQKYGDPITDDITWFDDLYKDSPSDYGLAIAVGDLAYYAEWEYEGTSIKMLLSGDNYEIEPIMIVYSDKNFDNSTVENNNGI